VANFAKFIQKLRTQFAAFWSGLSLTRKITASGIVFLVIAGMTSLLFLRKTNDYEYLFVDLSPDAIQAILTELKRSNETDFQVDHQGVKVPSNRVAELRMKLAQEGLPNSGIVGWEKFDTQDFTRTEFEQNIHKMRAIQGEIARTIQSIEGVTNARVHITSPKQSLFVEDQKEVTAAVYIKTKRGLTLTDRQIKGIQNLVCRSVEGLKPNNVTIIDQEGQTLTKAEAEDFASKMTKEMQTYKLSVEKDLEAKIRSLVARVVGPERVEAKVDVTVDFTQEEQTISDVDPEKSAVISKHTNGANMEGTGLNPTGIPGSKSNVPGEQEQLNVTTSGTKNKQESELVNFEVSKTLAKKTMPVGTIKRISAAVLVDGRQDFPLDGSKPVFEPRSSEEMKQISSGVEKALGTAEPPTTDSGTK